jgi:hypothetical protein
VIYKMIIVDTTLPVREGHGKKVTVVVVAAFAQGVSRRGRLEKGDPRQEAEAARHPADQGMPC